MIVEATVTSVREGQTEYNGQMYPKRWVTLEALSTEQPISQEPPREGAYIRAKVETEWRESKDGKRRPRYKLTAFRYIDF